MLINVYKHEVTNLLESNINMLLTSGPGLQFVKISFSSLCYCHHPLPSQPSVKDIHCVRTLSEASTGLVILRVLEEGFLTTIDSNLSRFWPAEAKLPLVEMVGHFLGLQLDSKMHWK